MFFINEKSPKDKQLLASCGIPFASFKKILSAVKKANETYFQLSPNHAHYHKMLVTSDLMMNSYLEYRKLPLKEKKEWGAIKNIKTGDRGYVNRHLTAVFKTVCPKILEELIEPKFSAQTAGNLVEALELSDEIDALLIGCSVPAYFDYLDKLAAYKKGVFHQLRRSYLSFIQIKALNVIAQFLKTFEQDASVLDAALMGRDHLTQWPRMAEVVSKICDQADPNHHDPLSLHSINSLRSIYVSAFNIALGLLPSKKEVPEEIRQFLPIIPDKINFSKNQLEKDAAWHRYQDHHFLFMRLPTEQRAQLGERLRSLTPNQRIMWMGCLGKVEIRTLILPLVAKINQFENLAKTCGEIPSSDQDIYPFSARVWEVLGEIYAEFLMRNPGTPESIHQLFEQVKKKGAKAVSAISTEEADLTVLRDLSFLVVDDSDRIRQMTTGVLKAAGVSRIDEAADGAEAWDFLQKHPVDVVLCDWIMPEMTGIQLVQKVMQVERIAQRTSFLMLTTVNNKANIVEALSVGVRGYLIKPFTRKQLLEKVFFATEWLRREQQSDKITTQTLEKRPTAAAPRALN